MLIVKNIIDSLFGQDYTLARFLFQKGLAAIYLVAFITALNQFKPLLGENGLLPIPRFLKLVKFNQAPSIFHWHYSDMLFEIVSWSGIIISILILIGLSDKLPWWGSALFWFALWVLYMSIVNVGQTFYAFGWESILLEAGFLAIFIGATKNAVPFVIILLLRWMLFRIEFGAGLIKIRGDECWRDLTCLDYHHETQPMPGPFSWFFHHIPSWMHRCEVAGNFFFQLVLPWGLFLPQPIPSIAAGLIIVSQLWLVISGNFSWLNWMTIVIAFSGFSNAVLSRILSINVPISLSSSPVHKVVVLAVSALLICLSYWPVKNMISKNQVMNSSFNAYHLVNTYGAFGSVTKKRYEIVIEGTSDEVVTKKTRWYEYEFKGKPGDVSKQPAQYAPYHLRLDWLMWFAAFGKERQKHWFIPLIVKLLKNDKETLKLIRYNPFPDEAPKHIRARYYLYQYTTPEERKETGNWWKRTPAGEYMQSVHLK